MTLDKTLEHFKTIDTDFMQFQVEWGWDLEEKKYGIYVGFYLSDKDPVTHIELFDDSMMARQVFLGIDEDDCLELYEHEKAKLN